MNLIRHNRYKRSTSRLAEIALALLCFCLDALSVIICNKHGLFFSAINYCVSLIIPTGRIAQIINIIAVVLIGLATGHNLSAVFLFLIFTVFCTFLLKPTLNETVPVFMFVITFYVWFYSLITGAGGIWTVFQFFANIVIIYVLLKLAQKRRAIA